jgi:hypothetical protein
MKTLHKQNLFCWSQFDEDRNIDFHSYAWVTGGKVIVFDPLPLSEHDKKHLDSLGKLSHIFITNSDHIRNTESLAKETGATIWAPEAEQENFTIECSNWLGEQQNILDGLDSYSLQGSKTDGELAFVIEGNTLLTGDLIRAHAGGKLCILPEPKLQDKTLASESVKRLASIKGIHAVLPGDGWPIFRNGAKVLSELVSSLSH